MKNRSLPLRTLSALTAALFLLNTLTVNLSYADWFPGGDDNQGSSIPGSSIEERTGYNNSAGGWIEESVPVDMAVNNPTSTWVEGSVPADTATYDSASTWVDQSAPSDTAVYNPVQPNDDAEAARLAQESAIAQAANAAEAAGADAATAAGSGTTPTFQEITEYDANNRLIYERRADGSSSVHTWHANGNLASSTCTGNDGVLISQSYYYVDGTAMSTGNNSNTTWFAGQVRDDAGRLTMEVDMTGQRTTYGYNTDGTLQLMTRYSQDGAVTHVERTEYEHYPSGAMMRQVVYGMNGDVLSQTWYAGEILDADGRVTLQIHGDGSRTSYQYGSNGKVLRAEHINAFGMIARVSEYYDSGRPSRDMVYEASYTPNAAMNEVVGEYWYEGETHDASGRLTLRVHADGSRTTYGYYDDGKLRERVDYDKTNQGYGLIRPLYREEYFNSGEKFRETIYGTGGQVLSERVYAGQFLDPQGRVIQSFNADGSHTDHTYHSNGRVSTMNVYGSTDPQSLTRTVTYFASGGPMLDIVYYVEAGFAHRSETSYLASGEKSSERYFDRGTLKKETLYNRDGTRTENEYDLSNARHNQLSVSTVYSAAGRIVQKTTRSYDPTSWNTQGNGGFFAKVITEVVDHNASGVLVRRLTGAESIFGGPLANVVERFFDGTTGNLMRSLDARGETFYHDSGAVREVRFYYSKSTQIAKASIYNPSGTLIRETQYRSTGEIWEDRTFYESNGKPKYVYFDNPPHYRSESQFTEDGSSYVSTMHYPDGRIRTTHREWKTFFNPHTAQMMSAYQPVRESVADPATGIIETTDFTGGARIREAIDGSWKETYGTVTLPFFSVSGASGSFGGSGDGYIKKNSAGKVTEVKMGNSVYTYSPETGLLLSVKVGSAAPVLIDPSELKMFSVSDADGAFGYGYDSFGRVTTTYLATGEKVLTTYHFNNATDWAGVYDRRKDAKNTETVLNTDSSPSRTLVYASRTTFIAQEQADMDEAAKAQRENKAYQPRTTHQMEYIKQIVLPNGTVVNCNTSDCLEYMLGIKEGWGVEIDLKANLSVPILGLLEAEALGGDHHMFVAGLIGALNTTTTEYRTARRDGNGNIMKDANGYTIYDYYDPLLEGFMDHTQTATANAIIQAIYDQVDEGRQVINISQDLDWDALSKMSELDRNNLRLRFQAAVDHATDHNVAIVVAAGNHGQAGMGMIAQLEGVITVGSVDFAGRRTDSSSTGQHLDFVAVADNIVSTTTTGIGYWSGTSFAAPQLAITIAKMIAYDLMVNGVRTITKKITDIMSILKDTSTDLGAQGHDSSFGWGLFNPFKAIQKMTQLFNR